MFPLFSSVSEYSYGWSNSAEKWMWLGGFLAFTALFISGLAVFLTRYYGTSAMARRAVADYLLAMGEGETWDLVAVSTGGYSRLWRVQATRNGVIRHFDVLAGKVLEIGRHIT